MPAHSMTSVSGFGPSNQERLYYGFSSSVDVAFTKLGVLNTMPEALMSIGYDQEVIDGLLEFAPQRKPVTQLDPLSVQTGQSAVSLLSRGSDIDNNSKSVLYGIRQFATHCTADANGGYSGVDSDVIRQALRATGLWDEAVQYCGDEGETSLFGFLSVRIQYPVYSRTAIDLFYGNEPNDRGISYENIERRRVIAAAELVMTVSHAIRNLEAASAFGGEHEAEVASRLEPLVRI